MTHAEKHVRNLRIIEERNAGRKMSEIAAEFGIAETTVSHICKAKGCRQFRAPADRSNVPKITGSDHHGWHGDEEAARIVSERIPDFEYVGGYTGTDGYADIRCKTCGEIIKRSWVTIRHGKATCDICEARRIEKAKQERETKRIAAAEEKERIRKEKAAEKQRLAEERERNKQERICSVCGQVFKTNRLNQLCCSPECSKRRQYKTHDKRLSKYGQKSNGITLAKLYRRDRGICYICGRTCDLNDKITDERGTVICGDTYPSIEHVIPLSLGGPNTWDNVRLACRGCNTAKNKRSDIKICADGRLAINFYPLPG